jgi:hypothetical protein
MGDLGKEGRQARTKADQVMNGAGGAQVVLGHDRLNGHVGIKAETGHHVMGSA